MQREELDYTVAGESCIVIYAQDVDGSLEIFEVQVDGVNRHDLLDAIDEGEVEMYLRTLGESNYHGTPKVFGDGYDPNRKRSLPPYEVQEIEHDNHSIEELVEIFRKRGG